MTDPSLEDYRASVEVMRKPALRVALGIVFLAVAVLCGASAARILSAGSRDHRLEVEGVITRSEVREVYAEDRRRAERGGESDGERLPSGYLSYIAYTYRVDGEEFEGLVRTGAGSDGLPHAIARSSVERYPVGRELTVFYEPDNPGRSSLQAPPVRTTARVIVVFFSIFIGLLTGGTALLIMLRADGYELLLKSAWQLSSHHRNTRRAARSRGVKKPSFLYYCAVGWVGLLGTVSFAIGIVEMRRGGEAESWPTVEGVVTTSSLVRSGSHRRVWYKALVSYRYSVAGRDYSGDRIAIGGEASGPKGRAERTVAAYPVGSPVPVFYDPARPESSVLEPEDRFVAMIWLCVGLVVFGAVALMVFLRYRARRDAAL